LTTKGTNFKIWIQDPWSTAKNQNLRKAKECHLEEKKATRRTKGTKSGRMKQKSKEMLKTKTEQARKAQNHKTFPEVNSH
jgi:hypothetical protein